MTREIARAGYGEQRDGVRLTKILECIVLRLHGALEVKAALSVQAVKRTRFTVDWRKTPPLSIRTIRVLKDNISKPFAQILSKEVDSVLNNNSNRVQIAIDLVHGPGVRLWIGTCGHLEIILDETIGVRCVTGLADTIAAFDAFDFPNLCRRDVTIKKLSGHIDGGTIWTGREDREVAVVIINDVVESGFDKREDTLKNDQSECQNDQE
ncbi:MAG: hypothetical protein J3R72DRAFT_465438 [Linnemannia gamsii]|nr:MAG: hypothetical protein J3R72DRAFT_465438 [Linnemannia gamsii]